MGSPAEAAAKARNLGVDIMAVGIANFDHDELLDVTQGDTKKVLTVKQYRDLVNVVNQTVKMICESAGVLPTPVPTPIPTAPSQPTPEPNVTTTTTATTAIG